jgi:hypothetical protein
MALFIVLVMNERMKALERLQDQIQYIHVRLSKSNVQIQRNTVERVIFISNEWNEIFVNVCIIK